MGCIPSPVIPHLPIPLSPYPLIFPNHRGIIAQALRCPIDRIPVEEIGASNKARNQR